MVPDRRVADGVRRAIEAEGDRVADLHLWRLGPGHLGAIVSVATAQPARARVLPGPTGAVRFVVPSHGRGGTGVVITTLRPASGFCWQDCVRCLGGPRQRRQPPPPLVLEATIPLPDTSGRIDHMASRPQARQAICRGTRQRHRRRGRSDCPPRPAPARRAQGAARRRLLPAADMVAVANAGDGSVHLFRGEDLAPEGVVELGKDADNIRVDPLGRFLVGFGDGGLAVIDPGSVRSFSGRACPAIRKDSRSTQLAVG